LLADLPYLLDQTHEHTLLYVHLPQTYYLFFGVYPPPADYPPGFKLGLTTSVGIDLPLQYHQGIVQMIAQDLCCALERRGFTLHFKQGVLL
jgi:hypothetical protein